MLLTFGAHAPRSGGRLTGGGPRSMGSRGSHGSGGSTGFISGGTGGGFNIQGPKRQQRAWVDGEHNNNYILVSEPYSHLNGLLTHAKFPQQHSVFNPRHSFVTAIGLTTEKDKVKFDFAHAPEIIHSGEDRGSSMKDGETTPLSNNVKALWDEPHRILHINTPSLTMVFETKGRRHPYLGSLKITKVDPKANLRGLVGGVYRGSYVDDHGPNALKGGDVRRMLQKPSPGKLSIVQPQGGGLIETRDPDGKIVLSKRGDIEAVNHYKTDSLFHIPQNNPFAVFQLNN